MHNANAGGHSSPATKIFTGDYSGRRAAAQHYGQGQLSPEDLRRLVAAMVD